MQASLLPEPEKKSTEGLRGLISRGIFTATKEEILRIVRDEHELKMEGLARHVLAMKTKEERRAWLLKFQEKHGYSMAEELKDRILEISRLGKSASSKSG